MLFRSAGDGGGGAGQNERLDSAPERPGEDAVAGRHRRDRQSRKGALDTAARMSPSDPAVLSTQGRLARARGQNKLAVDLLQQFFVGHLRIVRLAVTVAKLREMKLRFQHMQEQVSGLTAEAGRTLRVFRDFYESKGWLVGKVSMKDWRASARKWVRENAANPFGNGNGKANGNGHSKTTGNGRSRGLTAEDVFSAESLARGSKQH